MHFDKIFLLKKKLFIYLVITLHYHIKNCKTKIKSLEQIAHFENRIYMLFQMRCQSINQLFTIKEIEIM